jgi:uncharacterized protein (UPF0179 family)
MEESDTMITLIGTKLAKVGIEFIFKGFVKECEPCKFNKTCLGLNVGSKYRITGIRNGGTLECFIHDAGVRAVEVVEAPIVMGIEPRKAIKGSKIVYEPVICDNFTCDNSRVCRPVGLKKGDKFTIINVVGELSGSCEKGYMLKVAEVKR